MQDLTSWQEPWEDANIVGANGGGRDERLRESGHIEVAASSMSENLLAYYVL